MLVVPSEYLIVTQSPLQIKDKKIQIRQRVNMVCVRIMVITSARFKKGSPIV
jgi:hypothetical protein